MVLGDFNAIMASHERIGGVQSFSTRGIQSFRDMMQNCHLFDVGFQGSPFMWKHGSLFQRLDGALCNIQWRTKFPSASIIHLPFFQSDHRVIMVQMKRASPPNKKRRPFRFLASWLMHQDFPRFLAASWSRNASWCF